MTVGITELLERSAELESLSSGLAAAEAGPGGRLVLLAGEAGMGKTALLREFCQDAGRARVLWGACDALHTPRPLGPLLDIAADAGGQLGAVVDEGASPSEVVAALTSDLRRHQPTILVIEDLHWADEATLDAIRLLARRLDSLPALVVVTYREDEIDRTHPVRLLLGHLAGSRVVARVSVPALSLEAVEALAAGKDVDVELLHQRTGGNPFFVTEALASDGAPVPETVRDAVLARAARLDDPARALLDAVAVVPPRAELWLLEALAGEELQALERCLSSGMLNVDGQAIGFRHEIARVAIESALPLDRAVALHRAALVALESPPSGQRDPARLAHHAEMAGDAAAVLVYAPAAGKWAARVGAHSQAAAQFARALRFADGLPPEERAELLEHRSYECYLTDSILDAVEARRSALDEYRAAGNALREGDAHRWLSRLSWFAGDNETAEREANEAIALLEALPEGRELAMAYSNMSQLRMLSADGVATTEWGMRALTLAERLGETEILAHSLNNVGTAELVQGDPEGVAKLKRSLELSLANGWEEHVARAYTNLGSTPVQIRSYTDAEIHLDAGIAYCREHDLDSWLLYMVGWKARAALDLGRWDEAIDHALTVMRAPDVAAPSKITALVVVGHLRSRRGDPGVWEPLDEALELAEFTGEIQRLAPVAAARAEARWLAGEDDRVPAETERALALALEVDHGGWAGEMYAWRRRVGLDEKFAECDVSDPFRLELHGEHEAAAEAWRAIGCTFEAALALAFASDEAALRRGLAELQGMAARPAADRVSRTLRERGVRDVRQGPRRSTQENPAGLTARQLEVLGLVAEGLRNAEIANQLFLSEKTVDHHVSAILRKLGARTRGEAASKAAALGITPR
jgi:DNA-binding CsgD family transcriptional regulator/tetratricopeptide (TPR) repeat protein